MFHKQPGFTTKTENISGKPPKEYPVCCTIKLGPCTFGVLTFYLSLETRLKLYCNVFRIFLWVKYFRYIVLGITRVMLVECEYENLVGYIDFLFKNLNWILFEYEWVCLCNLCLNLIH